MNLRKIFHQWGGTTACFFTYTHLSHDLCTGLLVALLPFIRDGLGLNYLQSGLLLSAFAVTSGLSQFPGGWIGDRFSRRMVLAIGLSGIGLTGVAVGLTSAYYPLLFTLVVMGLFAGAYHPAAVSTLSGQFETARRGKAIALHMVGGSAGFTIGPILGGLIAPVLGWRLAFIILSLPTLIAVPLVLTRLKQPAGTHRDEPSSIPVSATDDAAVEAKQGGPSIGRVLRAVAVVITLVVLTQFVAGSAIAFIPIYLVDKHHVTPAYATMLLAIIRGGGLAGSLFGGWLSDKWTRRNALFLSLVVIGPMLYLITAFPFSAALLVVFVIFGLGMYMRQATIQSLLMDSTPPQLRATIFGIYFGLSMEGASLMQPVAGHFMDVFGIVPVFHVIALISVAISLAALLLAKSPKSRR